MCLLCSTGQSLRYLPGWGSSHNCVVALYVGEGPRGSNGARSTGFQSLPPLLTIKLGPSGADSRVGGLVHTLGLCGSPTNSPVRLGVSPAAASTPTGVFSQRFEALFSSPPRWSPGLRGLSPGPAAAALPRVLSAWLPVSAPPTVWVSVSSLSPWLPDFHTVRFSVSSGCFLFLNCCCPFFGCVRRHSVSTYASILARNPRICI